MSEESGKTEREQVSAELHRVREEVRARALHDPAPAEVLPQPMPVRTPVPMPKDAEPPPAGPPALRPDNDALNQMWRLRPALEGGGVRSLLARGLARALDRLVGTQEAFNGRQVQFDNELLAYVEARLDATHRQYDAVLGIHRRHMAEIDERHLILQEELVAHVHDLVKRIDLVLGASEKGRLSLEIALQDVRQRLKDLPPRG